MAAERIIGIDFGTSTSVVRVKRYKDGMPVEGGSVLDTNSVIFNGTYPTVPTLIQRTGDTAYYGYDAQVAKKKAISVSSTHLFPATAGWGARSIRACG